MAKVTITEIGSTLTNSAAAAINENFSRVQDAIENTLSRDGTAPNNMTADLDLDGNDILNVDNIHTDVLVLGGKTVTPSDLSQIPDTVMLKSVYDPTGENEAPLYPDVYDPQNIVGDAFDRSKHTGPVVWPVDTRTALKALDTTKYTIAFLNEGGREGIFKWRTGDFSSLISADNLEGLYVKADAVASSVGAWVRQGEWAVFGVATEWYGAVGNGFTSDSAAIQAAINSGYSVVLGKKDYSVTAPLYINTTGQKISGSGIGYGYGRPNFVGEDWEGGTRLIATGTFATRVMTRRLYRASGTDPTDDAMSAVIDIEADGVVLRDINVWLNTNWSDVTPGNYGDDVDIGVFVGCRPGVKMYNVGVIGHFRKAGIYFDVTRSLELPELTGFNGVAVPEGASGGSFAGGDGGVLEDCFVYGALGPSLAILGAIHPGGAYYDEATGAITDTRGASGFSDFRVRGCRFYSAQHQSGRRTRNPTGYGGALSRVNMEAEDTFFPACVYIDGWAANSGSTTHSVGALRNMVFEGTRFSSSEAFRVRLGTCDQIKFVNIAWIESGDFPSGATSWKDTLGVDISINDYTNITYGHIATHTTNTGKISADDVVGGLNQTWVANPQRFEGTDGNGRRRAKAYESGVITIADDAVGTITPPTNGGFVLIMFSPDTTGPQLPRSGGVVYDVGSSLAVSAFANGANFVTSTSDVTGTTGVDGNITVAVQAGVIKIENRGGGSALFRYTFL